GQRRALYALLEAERAVAGLIFVTGRDLPFIEELCATTTVPWPDYVIGDVGTTIATVDQTAAPGRRITPHAALEAPIAALWADRGDAVRAHLDGAAGLKPQDTPFRYRMSYHYDPPAYDPAVETGIVEMGLDVLISADEFLDVLPKGVNKGSSLLRLIDHLRIAPQRVLVAGDTLNDLSLFETGLPGVAVGNSEPALKAKLQGIDTTYHADGHGAAGVQEAIRHFDFLPANGGP
ncbi:MAG: HAD family hydrolase, partial [Pseudomonadota bacterium]